MISGEMDRTICWATEQERLLGRVQKSSCGIGESKGGIGETEKENRGLSGAEASTTSKQALGFFLLDSKPREA
ncbi:hypothetical protein HZH68_003779 [Vespula germanica]|uniref:Uncharacterized protein n=1 Tax=Vespula germanica TaxID=30212 RepID=A0A834NJ65_VESGE|nr:hypothetical protein HZH68_003779 [Vespula germanica]